jgi:quercetin dioxygenase-like cupin family protein
MSFETAIQALMSEPTAERGGTLAVVEQRGRRGEMTPVHRHSQDEVVHVMEGALVLVVGEERVHLRPGKTYSAPRATAHALVVESEKARYVNATVVRSAARYEDFLRAVAIPGEGAQAAWEEGDAGRLAALAAPNGIESPRRPSRRQRIATGASSSADR